MLLTWRQVLYKTCISPAPHEEPFILTLSSAFHALVAVNCCSVITVSDIQAPDSWPDPGFTREGEGGGGKGRGGGGIWGMDSPKNKNLKIMKS